ncbi:cytochrome P450 [Gandjariella thermophila]|uniref:Cytochrome P450 n=1 Tax=Gandjariella thermophila TaxID=1931992 RepID=A0A4D4IZC4_9PSEU|nr:cytochrome P450 [Gandjariella thermophila]GDY29695.1 cytochrome P450 [Gandjariella thermophila]
MNRDEFRLAVRAPSFLDSHATAPGVLELRPRPRPRLLVWHPEAVAWIHRNDQDLRHAGSRLLTRMLGQRSLLWTDGPRHLAYRRVLGPALTGRRREVHRQIVSDTAHSAIDALGPGDVIRVPRWTRDLTLRVISRIVLGRADGALLAPFSAWIENTLGAPHRALANRFLRTHAWWPIAMAPRPMFRRDLDRALVRSAEAAASTRPAGLAGLLRAGDGPLGHLDDGELRDQVASLLFAGYETTASSIAWTLYWLDRHDGVRRDILAELAATSDDGSDAARVPLLHAAVQEALRLTPPAIVTEKRILPADADLLGRTLPAGSVLTPCVYLAHRHPDRFPRPHRYDPGRFLGRRVSGAHYFPFGGGSRYCLGRDLALLEIRMIVAAVLRRRELRCVDPDVPRPELRGAASAPPANLRMVVTACHR